MIPRWIARAGLVTVGLHLLLHEGPLLVALWWGLSR